MPKGVRHARPPHGARPDPRSESGERDLAARTRLALVPLEEPAGPPRRRKGDLLPDDDPITLIAALDASGGVDGARPRMTPVAAEAFRVLCGMPPIMRTLPRLRERLAEQWGKAPNRKTLEVWSSKFGWQELLGEYDKQLGRYRLWQEEDARHKATARQAKMGRWMASKATQRMEAMFSQIEQAEQGNLGKLQKPPTLNGLHALAVTAKAGFEMERVALGMPTIISNSSLQTENLNINADAAGLSLDEWRRQLAAERGSGSGGVGGVATPHGAALPQPRLQEHEAAELPEVWGEVVEGTIAESASSVADVGDHELA